MKSVNSAASDEGNGAVQAGDDKEEAGGAPAKRARKSRSQEVAAKADEDLTRSGLKALSKVRSPAFCGQRVSSAGCNCCIVGAQAQGSIHCDNENPVMRQLKFYYYCCVQQFFGQSNLNITLNANDVIVSNHNDRLI